VPPMQHLVSDWLGDAIMDGSTQPLVCVSVSGCTISTTDEVQPLSAETKSLLVLEDTLCNASPASSRAAPAVFEELDTVLTTTEVAFVEKTSSRPAANDHDPFAACKNTSRKVTGHISDEQLLQDVYIVGSEGPSEMEGNIGDRLRRAVMDGHTNTVMGLFKECNSSTKEVKCCDRVASEAVVDRFAALSELQSTQENSHSNRYFPESLQNIVSPQQLSELSSQRLLQMKAMVSHAIHQHSEAPATSSAPESHASQQFGDVLMAFQEKNPSWDDKHRRAPTKKKDPTTKEFGDLIESFNEKNAISGFKSS